MSVGRVLPKDLLLVVFIHGFRGGDDTFAQFPERLNHVLSESIPDVIVKTPVFPAYETKGELKEAVDKFSDWLAKFVHDSEEDGTVHVRTVLCGHSMGGLVAADTLLKLKESSSIIAIISFDTPYFGVHPNVFKNSATKATEYANLAHTVGSAMLGSVAAWGTMKGTEDKPKTPPPPPPSASTSSWSSWGWGSTPSNSTQMTKDETDTSTPTAEIPQRPENTSWRSWGLAGGLVAATAAAGAAYYKREDIGLGYGWVQDHLRYVGTLWDEKAMKDRVDQVIASEGVLFKNFYTVIPPPFLSPSNPSRTFVVLPPKSSHSYTHFMQAPNESAADEVTAHMNMFSPKTNKGYYNLGLEAAKYIREAYALDKTK